MAVTIATERHYETAARKMLDGDVVPFLGAGAHLAGRPENAAWRAGCGFLPNGWELANALAEKVRYPDPDDRDLMRITQFIEADEGVGPLYRYVRRQFDDVYDPTALHHFLAEVAARLRMSGTPRQVILTTNYDDALEEAFKARDEPYELIWYQAHPRHPDCGHFLHALPDGPAVIREPNDYDKLDPDACTVIVKLHGAMIRTNRESDSYVITEQDYIRYLPRSDVTSQIPAVLRPRIRDSHLLFLGYGMRDWNLRVVLERLGGEIVSRDYQSWCVQREPDTEGAKLIEAKLWGDRDVDLVYTALDVYDERLRAEMPDLSPE